MRKGLHPQRQWMSYVTQSGRLINIMMTKIHHVGKVYHFRADGSKPRAGCQVQSQAWIEN
ncbi:Ribosomal protein l31 [Thalictrum thalictroides]|uniref:Ribosomal protein l31 n=1 Tax=Thalictrum thalictroides TaxID=46969 RepID=A0A7J6USD3_THATH|nr:Ribosomal protein l31 [Thalictrum thalictroides]